MTLGITYTNAAGTSVSLNSTFYDSEIFFLGGDNFGLSPLHIVTERSPVQQGETFRAFRLDPRIILVPLLVKCYSLQQQLDMQSRLLNIFKPTTQYGVFSVVYPNGMTKNINTRVIGGMEFNQPTEAGYSFRTVVKLYCGDPTWYNPDQNIIPLYTQSGTPLAYPKAYPVNYGTVTDSYVTLQYAGSWVSYPIITVTGPITNFSLTNVTKNQNITVLAGTTIPAGTTWRFDLSFGEKTVYDQSGNNKISLIDPSSELAQFAMYPEGDVPAGINVLTLTGTGMTTATTVYMSYYDRFIGL